MQDYQIEFIRLALQYEALLFGEFTLKSGRKSPYFFNMGHLHDGAALAALGRYYAQAIVNSGISFDMLFGPAYKGIPIACVTAAALYEHHRINVPYAFNRKEAKDHGEGGTIVGAHLDGRVLILDDVITAGTASTEAINMIKAANATPVGLVIALDRQEVNKDEENSAIQLLCQQHALDVANIINVDCLMEYLEAQGDSEHIAAMQAYRDCWGENSQPHTPA